ncbi:MAG: hypothetical protein GY953_52660 [bacterium]|nr:hypothetical protein [bacterium]
MYESAHCIQTDPLQVAHYATWFDLGGIVEWKDTENDDADGATEGMIAVQVDGGKHRFRNIAVKVL